jgi:hypothetical protein
MFLFLWAYLIFWAVLATAVTIAGPAAAPPLPSPWLFFAPTGVFVVVVLALGFLSRPVFVAVTQRQLICYRLSRMAGRPVRLLFSAPLAAVRVTPGRRMPVWMGGWRSIRYDGPGAEGRGLRLAVGWPQRRQLDEVLAALRDRGASVTGAPDPRLGRPPPMRSS